MGLVNPFAFIDLSLTPAKRSTHSTTFIEELFSVTSPFTPGLWFVTVCMVVLAALLYCFIEGRANAEDLGEGPWYGSIANAMYLGTAQVRASWRT